jgi:predicted RNase H-like HicB family nuclease
VGIYLKGKDFYPAIVTLADGMFEAKLVDFPNCIAVGSSGPLAEARAEKALNIFLESRRKWAQPVPAPSVVIDERAAHRYTAYIPARLGSDDV